MSEQYFHQSSGEKRFTVCIVPPTPEKLINLLSAHSTTIPIEIGVATCSPEDNYNKKIGRDISKSRLNQRIFFGLEMARFHTRAGFFNSKDEYIIVLQSSDEHLTLRLRFVDGKEKVIFFDAEMN